ncbi:MAG: hypothetical protein WCH91_13675, partial [bacterium]
VDCAVIRNPLSGSGALSTLIRVFSGVSGHWRKDRARVSDGQDCSPASRRQNGNSANRPNIRALRLALPIAPDVDTLRYHPANRMV